MVLIRVKERFTMKYFEIQKKKQKQLTINVIEIFTLRLHALCPKLKQILCMITLLNFIFYANYIKCRLTREVNSNRFLRNSFIYDLCFK